MLCFICVAMNNKMSKLNNWSSEERKKNHLLRSRYSPIRCSVFRQWPIVSTDPQVWWCVIWGYSLTSFYRSREVRHRAWNFLHIRPRKHAFPSLCSPFFRKEFYSSRTALLFSTIFYYCQTVGIHLKYCKQKKYTYGYQKKLNCFTRLWI